MQETAANTMGVVFLGSFILFGGFFLFQIGRKLEFPYRPFDQESELASLSKEDREREIRKCESLLRFPYQSFFSRTFLSTILVLNFNRVFTEIRNHYELGHKIPWANIGISVASGLIIIGGLGWCLKAAAKKRLTALKATVSKF
jgi:hypothetical protein